MLRGIKHVATAMTVVGTVLVARQLALAQNPYNQIRPGLSAGQYAYNTALIGQAAQYANANLIANAAYSQALNPYTGYGGANPYSSYYYPNYDPYGGYLRGGADVINSQGQLMVNQQQAFLMREQVHSARIDNRRKAFDEYLYERERTPTPEEERQFAMRQQLLRSRNDPPVTEIFSGQALNSLLADLKKAQDNPDAATLRTFDLPLDEDALKNINLTKSAGNGSVGILRNEGRLSWPASLSSNEFKDAREEVNALAQEAVKQAQFNGQVDAGTITKLNQLGAQLQRQLRAAGSGYSFDQYRDAKGFLNNLEDAVKVLQQPDVGNYFTGKYTLTGVKSVPELVKRMSASGLSFAPALPGQESAYNALHQALAGYDLAMRPTVQR
jgi:hypothetical protein